MSARSKPHGLTAAMPSSRTPTAPWAPARLKVRLIQSANSAVSTAASTGVTSPPNASSSSSGVAASIGSTCSLDEGLVDLRPGLGGGVLLVVLLGHAVEPVQPLGVVRRDAGHRRGGPAPVREQRRAGQRPRAAAGPAER